MKKKKKANYRIPEENISDTDSDKGSQENIRLQIKQNYEDVWLCCPLRCFSPSLFSLLCSIVVRTTSELIFFLYLYVWCISISDPGKHTQTNWAHFLQDRKCFSFSWIIIFPSSDVLLDGSTIRFTELCHLPTLVPVCSSHTYVANLLTVSS